MTPNRLPEPLHLSRFVAVLRRIERNVVLDMARQLLDADLPVVEVTMDSSDALPTIGALRELGCVVGAGTVRNEHQARAAVDAGARFLVSPVFDPAVFDASQVSAVPYIPGCFSPTDIARALEAGALGVKLFPAGGLGPRVIRSLRGPFPEIGIVATGAIPVEDAASYVQAGVDQVGIGLAPSSLTHTIETLTADLNRSVPPD